MSLKCNIRLALLPLGLAGLVLIAAHPAAAQTNLVQNAGFKSPALKGTPGFGTGYNNNNITNWTGTSSVGSSFGVQSKVAYPALYPGGIPGGNQFGYVNRGDIFQNLATTLTPGHTYTLSAYLGVRSDATLPATGHIELVTAGGTFLSGAASGLTSAKGTFKKYSYTLAVTNSSTGVGSSLRVLLGNDRLTSGGQQVDFDNVSLTDTLNSCPGAGGNGDTRHD